MSTIEKFYPIDEFPMVLTVDDLCNFLGIGRSKGYELVRSNRLAVVRIGRSIRIPRHSVLRFLESETST